MSSGGDSELVGLDAQLAIKEREWKELLTAKIHQLESFLKKAQEECSILRERYQQLREDFQFNLAILDERDRELEKYDFITSRALTVKHSRQEKLHQLHMQVAKLEEQRARETEEQQKELSKCQRSVAQHRLQLDELKRLDGRFMVGEIQKQTEEYERMKGDLQCRIHELEGELTIQKQVMTAASDHEFRQKEHECNLKMDEMRAVVLSHDLKVQLLSKETDVARQAHLQATEALKASQSFCQQVQIQLQHKEQELKDLTAAKDSRIKELEAGLKWMEAKLKKGEDNHIKKYKDVIRALKEHDVQLEAQCQAHTERLQKAEKRLVRLQENMKVLASQVHCMQKDHLEAMGRKDDAIQRLRTEVETTRAGWDRYITQVSSEMVVKDTEIITLKERESKLRTEVERSREEMEGYKKQLSAGLQRERALEQKRVQLELEWQRRCEDLRAEHYLANEQLIQDLTQTRDQAKAELKGKEQELQDLTVLLRSVYMERDQAIKGLVPKVDSMASEEIRCLQEQNRVLRAVVTQMRKDMEDVSHLRLQAQPQASSPQPVHQEYPAQVVSGQPAKSTDICSNSSPADHTHTLAKEVSLLKAKCRGLEKRLEEALQPCSAPATDQPTEQLAHIVPESTLLQDEGHKQGGLCLEKHANTSALTKQGVRVAQIMDKRARLQEKNLFLQQQASGLMSSGLSKNVGAKNNPTLLHTRLKQAAFCIARLSKEKQQLIEMGNRLRAQITIAGLKEHFPERDSTEILQEQNDQLSALERLQYQLTTQELQYALRQRACTFAELQHTEVNNRGSAAKGSANPWSQGHSTTERPENFMNKENTPPHSQSQSTVGPQPHSGLSRSLMSSEESLKSLNELWEMLDHGLSSSVFSEGEVELSRREVAESDQAGLQMMVHGISVPIHYQPPTEVQHRRNSSTPSNITRTSRPGARDRIRKIRNYNIKH